MATRLLCVKDFLKRCAILPLALLKKGGHTAFKLFAALLGIGVVVVSVGSSCAARQFFVSRILALAVDIADWLLFPFAVISCVIRLVMALLIHPHFYFNAISE